MNILFLTAYKVDTLNKNGLYEDLLNEFVRHGHHVTIITPTEDATKLTEANVYSLIKVKTATFQKTNFIQKGIATLLLPMQFKNAIKKYLDGKPFDLILYSTPPITLAPVVQSLKRTSGAFTFLLLKDIWPQEMVDVGAIRSGGAIWHYFRSQEEKLYRISDRIGCTSKANVDYLASHNKGLDDKIVIVTNGLSGEALAFSDSKTIKAKYGIPTYRKLFFYGGNLGVPQDIPFVVQAIGACAEMNDVHFVICGKGTQAALIQRYLESSGQKNLSVLSFLPQEDYEKMVAAADVCMVFLNHAFTVPNCPARFYTYLKIGKPVLACTDCATDIGRDISNGGFGWWCESTDSQKFACLVKEACSCDLSAMGKNARSWFEQYYTTETAYRTICCSLKGQNK